MDFYNGLLQGASYVFWNFRLRFFAVMVLVLTAGVTFAAGLSAFAQEVGGEQPPDTPILQDVFTSSNEMLFALLLPAFLPWAIGVLVQDSMSALVRQIVTFLICGVAALGFLFYQDEGPPVISWDGLPRLAIIVAAITYGYFRMWQKPVRDLEQKSNIRG